MKKFTNGNLTIGIVGLGAIGSFLLSNLQDEKHLTVTAAAETSKDRRDEIAKKYPDLKLYRSYTDFPDEVDVIVECAMAAVADEIARWGIERGKAVIIASVGGLSDIRPLRRLARETGGHLYIPSGAIAGLDALKAIPSESIMEVMITTTKNPAKFKGSEYVKNTGINLDEVKVPTIIFDGHAGNAVKAFPRNINVSAILSYAGIGRANTRVVIKADPAIKTNRHQIHIKSDHGEINVQVDNVAFEVNPRTSKLAAYSILAAVRALVYTITIG